MSSQDAIADQLAVAAQDLKRALDVETDLEAENARLQAREARVEEMRANLADALARLADERDGYKALAERRGEALVRTGKWTRLADGYLMCRVCCTGMRCECEPGEHVSREGCSNCLGQSGAALAATPELTNC